MFALYTTTFLLILLTLLSWANSEIINTSSWSSLSVDHERNDLQEMLKTEKHIIDTLRRYIKSQEFQLNSLKRQIVEIRAIHDDVNDYEKYINNPINALKILKRFTEDWKNLKKYAEEFLQAKDFIKNYKRKSKKLKFPTDEDYDAALNNLLRIQDMYQLEPQHIALGELNGVKLGSEMTWSDCLEIGLMSSKNGYQTNAKYWMETALEKLSNIYNNSSVTVKSNDQDNVTIMAKLKIMQELLKTEYDLGNLQTALNITNEILKLQPKEKSVIKAKAEIKEKLQQQMDDENLDNINHGNTNKNVGKQKMKLKTTKTLEELMIEEICRDASSLQSNQQIHTASWNSFTSPSSSSSVTPTHYCAYVTNNLPFLLMQPFKVEILRWDPYIVIYHNILSDNELKELKDFVVAGEEQQEQGDSFKFTKIGQKKMRQINRKLHYIIGHYDKELYNDWQVKRYNFENLMDFDLEDERKQGQSKLLLHLQQAYLGGSVIFPQLELGTNLPMGSVLYWSTLNEFHSYDYRTKYHVCPVIVGSQLTATTSIKNI